MSIQRLEIAGFRSLENVSWEPGPLNVLIGLNDSGKSNMLRALLLIKNAAEGRLSESVRASGGMAPLVWDGQSDKLRFVLRTDPVAPGLDRVRSALTYELILERLGQTGAFRVGKESLVSPYKYEHGEAKDVFKFLERTSTWAVVYNPEQHGLDIKSELIKEDETLLTQVADPASYPTNAAFRRMLADYSIYHDVHVDSNSEMRRAAVSRRDMRIDHDGSNLVSVLHTLYTSDRFFKDEFNTAMKAAFGEKFEELVFPPAEDGRVQLRVRWRSLKREQSAADLSDGTLRFLFLITVLASPEPPPLIAIDEPETGLHPSMFPLVAEHAADAARRTQVILTTHSPQFLNAFKGRADITTIAEWREGKTHLRRLPEAELAKWLEHYQLGDLMLSGELENIG